MTDRAQMGPTPVRVPMSGMAVLIGILVANETATAIGAVVAVGCLAVVWYTPLAGVIADD